MKFREAYKILIIESDNEYFRNLYESLYKEASTRNLAIAPMRAIYRSQAKAMMGSSAISIIAINADIAIFDGKNVLNFAGLQLLKEDTPRSISPSYLVYGNHSEAKLLERAQIHTKGATKKIKYYECISGYEGAAKAILDQVLDISNTLM